MKYTKIVATLGPASSSTEMIKRLYDAGMNVARLNCSHANHEELLERIKLVRSVSEHIAILLDTKGPEVRTRDVDGEVYLHKGTDVVLTNEEGLCTHEWISMQYDGIFSVPNGTLLLIDDGLIMLETFHEGDVLKAKVLHGGELKSKKTVSFRGYNIDIPFMSERDKADIAFGIEHGVDFIAASFVRSAEDVELIREMTGKDVNAPNIIAKIEHPEAVQNIRAILKVTDGIMVARGDLGVEMDLEQVPQVQQDIVRLCNEIGKPVIVATQMLESMRTNSRPTRAEVSDVTQAILQGADAIMLSAETAAGKYPVESVQVMTRIAYQYDGLVTSALVDIPIGEEDIKMNKTTMFITKAAYLASEDLDVKAIFTPTFSGYTPRKVSRFRPKCPIFAVTNSMTVCRQLQLNWGVVSYFEENTSQDYQLHELAQHAITNGFLGKDDLVIVTAGYQVHQPRHTNMMEVVHVKQLLEVGK
jgi:pyruvate kinase